MLNSRSTWRNRWLILFGCIILYLIAHFVHLHNSHYWLPEIPTDVTLTKKNADGPLILRDDIFNNGDSRNKNSKILRGAGILAHTEILFDQPIQKIEESPPAPINISSTFINKFQKTAKLTANNTDDFVLFSVINEGYFNLTANFLCNLYAIGNEKLHKKIFIVALQEETCENLKAEWPKIQCLWLETDDVHNEGVEWGKKVYVQILTFRARLLDELSKLRIPFILFESDAIWFKSPFDLIRNSTAVDDVDIIIPVNSYPGKQKLAFDPLVAFNTTATSSFFSEMRSRLESNPELMDQEVLNELCSSQFKGVVCRNFEWSDVADGKWFKMSDRERKNYFPFIVNNNYYVGVKNKAARQAINGLWFLSPKGHCNLNKAKKLLAKYKHVDDYSIKKTG